ncbi:MAG: hypothetical protein QW794_07255 [Thermosphaera sp.]
MVVKLAGSSELLKEGEGERGVVPVPAPRVRAQSPTHPSIHETYHLIISSSYHHHV